MVLMDVNELRSPSVKRSPEPKHVRYRGGRPDASGDLEQLDIFAPECLEQSVSFHRRPAELQGV